MIRPAYGKPDKLLVHPVYRQRLRGTLAFVALLAVLAAVAAALPELPGMRGIASYLPLHMLLETIAIVVSMLVFAIGWHAHSRHLPGTIVLLGCAFFGVGLLDFAHMLSYAGMPDFVTPSNPEKGIDFWLAARSLAALSLLAAALMPWRPFVSGKTRYLLLAAAIAVNALAYWLILLHQGEMPHTFIPGEGLTDLKIYWEYTLIALNLAAAFALWRRMSQPQPFDAAALLAAVCVMALSEYFFTIYSSVTDIFNLLGHIYKAIAYLLLYRTFFIGAVETPYRQLHASETKLHTLYESTSDAVMLVDDRGLLECNRAAAAMFGCASREELLMKHPADISPPSQPDGGDSKTLAEHNNATAMATGHHQFEWICRRLDDGRLFPVEVLLNRMELDGKVILQATVRDITERKRFEEALKKSNELWHYALEGAGDGVWDWDMVSNRTYFSPRWNELIGYAEGDFDNTFECWRDHLHPDDLERTLQTLRGYIEGRIKNYHVEFRMLCKDGSWKWILARGKVVDWDNTGRPLRMIGTHADISARKQAEEALRASEERSRAIIEASPVPFALNDEALNITYLNGAFIRTFGYTPEDIPTVAEWWPRAYPDPAYREWVKTTWVNSLEEAKRENKPFEPVELTIRCKGGAIRTALVGATPLGASFEGVHLVSLYDITGRKLAEKTLSESEERMRLAAKASEVGFWEWNVVDNTIKWDEQMFRIYGIPSTENQIVNYADWKTAVLPEDLPQQERILQETIRNSGQTIREFRIRRRSDGELRTIQAVDTVRGDAAGKAAWVVGTNRDITDLKNNMVKIERLSSIYRLLSRVNEAIVRATGEAQLYAAICSAAVESGLFRFIWIGVLDEQKLAVIPVVHAGAEEGFLDTVRIRLDDEDTGKGPIATALRTNNSSVCANIADSAVMSRLPWRDEAIRRGYRSFAAFPVCERGIATGVLNAYSAEPDFFTEDIIRLMQELAADVSFALDVFDERRRRESAEDEIRQINANLERRVADRTHQLEVVNKELEAFCYSVSHDLRAPLRSIDGFSQVLLNKFGGQLDAQGNDYLERVRRASQHMGRLIDDMLRLSQVSRGELKRLPVDLGALAKNALDDLRHAHPERQVRFTLQEGLEIYCDPGLMRIVINNLLGNAWKYSGKKPMAEIEFGACDISSGSGMERAFFVRDNGSGFSMEYAHKLFVPFQRLHGADEFEGTGIGLATVQRIIHRQHGKVWAEAREGEGATFYFTLPQRNMKTRRKDEQ